MGFTRSRVLQVLPESDRRISPTKAVYCEAPSFRAERKVVRYRADPTHGSRQLSNKLVIIWDNKQQRYLSVCTLKQCEGEASRRIRVNHFRWNVMLFSFIQIIA